MEINEFDDYDEFDEEQLQEVLFFAKDEYEQWTRNMDIARNYACELDQMNMEKHKDIDRMRELVDENDYKLVTLIDEKESLLGRMQDENVEFMDNIERECKTKGKQHEEKIEKIYAKLNRNGV